MAKGYFRNWDNPDKKGRSERKPHEKTKCKTCGTETERCLLPEHIRSGECKAKSMKRP